MKSMTRSALTMMALACAVAAQVTAVPVPQQHHTYPGTITTPGGGLCRTTFLYDGGNLSGAVFVPQGCATDAGLGVSGPGGVFTPPAGTACTLVNGTVPVWVFPCITVAATDVTGQVCFCKSTVYVVKDAGSYLNIGLLSRSWGQCVGACDDATNGAYWPSWPTAAVQVPSTQHAGFRSALPREVFPVTLSGPSTSQPSATTAGFAVYSSVAGYTFVPRSVVAELGLSTVAVLDLAVLDPISLLALDINALRANGQTVFDAVWLDGIDLGDGTLRSGHALAIDDDNSSYVVLGGRGNPIMQGVGFVPGAAPGGHDYLAFGGGPAPAGPAVVPYGVTPAAVGPLGSVLIAPHLPPEGFVEGCTFISFNCLAPFGFGPLLGLYEDAVTAIPFSRPATPGDLFHFTASPGLYPEVPLQLPNETMPPGAVADIAMAFRTPSGQIRVTGPMRLSRD
jgi:hypothetical protein